MFNFKNGCTGDIQLYSHKMSVNTSPLQNKPIPHFMQRIFVGLIIANVLLS